MEALPSSPETRFFISRAGFGGTPVKSLKGEWAK
jgi:hypothetical protein